MRAGVLRMMLVTCSHGQLACSIHSALPAALALQLQAYTAVILCPPPPCPHSLHAPLLRRVCTVVLLQ